MKTKLLKRIALLFAVGLTLSANAQETQNPTGTSTIKLPRHIKITSDSWGAEYVHEGNLTYDELGRLSEYNAEMYTNEGTFTYKTAFTWDDQNRMLTEENANRMEKNVNIYDEKLPDFWIGQDSYDLESGKLDLSNRIEHKFDNDGKWIGIKWNSWSAGYDNDPYIRERDISVDKYDDRGNISELTFTYRAYNESDPASAWGDTVKFVDIKWARDVDYDEFANLDYEGIISGNSIAGGDFPQFVAFNFLITDKNQVESFKYVTSYSEVNYTTQISDNMKAIISETYYPEYPEDGYSYDVTYRKYDAETGEFAAGTCYPDTKEEIVYESEYEEKYVPLKPELSFLKLSEEMFGYRYPYYSIPDAFVSEGDVLYGVSDDGVVTYGYDEENNMTSLKVGKYLIEMSDFGEYAGVNTIAQDSQWSAKGMNGAIELSSANSQPAIIYNLSGKIVYSNASLASETISMVPGLYVVKIGNNVRKVIVR